MNADDLMMMSGTENAHNVTLTLENTSSYHSAALESITEYIIADYLNRSYRWILFFIGFFGNVACIVTVQKMSSKNSSSLYISILAISDLSAVTIKLVYWNFEFYVVDIGNFACKLFQFLGNVCNFMSTWILICLSVERLVATWFPLKMSTFGTKTSAKRVILVMAVVSCLLNIQYFVTIESTSDYITKVICIIGPKYEYLEMVVWPWVDGCLVAFGPLFLIMIFNMFIVLGIRRSKKLSKAMTSEQKRFEHRSKQQRQITMMLIAVSLAFLILVTPYSVFWIIVLYWDYQATNLGIARFFLARRVVTFLHDANHVVNFFLYFISGQKFRQNAVKVFCNKTDLQRRFGTASFESLFRSSRNRSQ